MEAECLNDRKVWCAAAFYSVGVGAYAYAEKMGAMSGLPQMTTAVEE